MTTQSWSCKSDQLISFPKTSPRFPINWQSSRTHVIDELIDNKHITSARRRLIAFEYLTVWFIYLSMHVETHWVLISRVHATRSIELGNSIWERVFASGDVGPKFLAFRLKEEYRNVLSALITKRSIVAAKVECARANQITAIVLNQSRFSIVTKTENFSRNLSYQV